MVTNVKLMADYECFPLWGMDVGQIGEIDPNWLPLSEETKRKLIDWGKKYDHTLNRSNPASSGFKSQEAEEHFEREGYRLWKELQVELGSQYRVYYHSSVTGRDHDPADDR